MIFGLLIYSAGFFMLLFFSSKIWLFFTMGIISLGEIVYSSTVTASAINIAQKNILENSLVLTNWLTVLTGDAGLFYGGVIFSIIVSSYYRWSMIFFTPAVSSWIYTIVMNLVHEHEKH